MRDSGHVAVCTYICVKRQFNAQEETLVLSGTQRCLGGPLCANKLQKNVMSFALANCQTACFGCIFHRMVSFVCGKELAIYQEELKI